MQICELVKPFQDEIQYSNEYITGLSQLEMISTDNDSNGLINISELENSTITYSQRLALEKGKKIGADAIYFRNFPDLTRPSKPQLYVFDFTKEEKNIVEIHKSVWSSSEVRFILLSQERRLNYSIPQSL